MCNVQRYRSGSGLVLKDDVPFSCCDPSVIRPCVHQAMRDRTRHATYPVGNSTLYKAGCSVAVHQHTAWVGSWIFYGLVTLTGQSILLIVACRYLQTSISEALHDGTELLPSRGYMLSFGRRNVPGTRAPPPSPATQPQSPRPPTKVAQKTDAKRRRRRRRNTSKSNRQANNSSELVEEDLISDHDEQRSVNSDLELIAERLVSLALSDRMQPTSGAPSDGGTTTDLPPPTVIQPVSDSGTTSRVASAVQSSVSPSLSVGSSLPSFQENWNSNARVDFNSLRRIRSTRPVAPSSIASVVPDRDENNLTIDRGLARPKTKRKYPEQSKSQRGSTSRSDRRTVVNRRRLSRVKERSPCRTEKTTETRKHERSRRSEDTSVSSSSASGSSQHVTSSNRMKTHTLKHLRHAEPERDVRSRRVAESYRSCGSDSSSLDRVSEDRGKNALRLFSKPKPSTSAGRIDCVRPMMMSVGSPETRSVDGGSSEWSTVSCHTVGKGSVTGSERSTYSKRKVEDNNAAALVSLNNYLGTYNGDVMMPTDSHESRKFRSRTSSKLDRKSSASTNYRTLPAGRMCRPNEMPGTSKSGRTSNNSWSTVSYETLSRPPSSEYRACEIFVEEECARSSTGWRTKSERVCQTNNNRNSLEQSASSDVVCSSKICRRSSQNLQHLDSEWISSSTTISWLVEQASCDSRSITQTGSTSMKQLTRRKYNKLSNSSTLPSPLVHTAIGALQQRLDASVPNTALNHSSLDRNTSRHPGQASSDGGNLSSARKRRRKTDVPV